MLALAPTTGAEKIGKLGHAVKLIVQAYVKPFVKRQKNDAADAEAICEAAQRPTMLLPELTHGDIVVRCAG